MRKENLEHIDLKSISYTKVNYNREQFNYFTNIDVRDILGFIGEFKGFILSGALPIIGITGTIIERVNKVKEKRKREEDGKNSPFNPVNIDRTYNECLKTVTVDGVKTGYKRANGYDPVDPVHSYCQLNKDIFSRKYK